MPDRPLELFILDGTAMLFRSYFAGVDYVAPDGTQVGAVWLVTRRIQQLLQREWPDRVAVVFDSGRQTFRTEAFPDYKANRGLPPDDLRPQFHLVREAVKMLGLATFSMKGFEADDLMATLATLARGAGMHTRLRSVDKDLCQLVDDDPPPIILQDTRNGRILNAAGVADRMGVGPGQIVDYLALVGDSSDNVPGVRGVGPKTARALLACFADLDALYADLPAVAGVPVRGAKTLGAKLEAGREDAYRARSLVVLKRDVDMGLTPELLDQATLWSGPRGEDADALFARLGFQGPLRGLRSLAEGARTPSGGWWRS